MWYTRTFDVPVYASKGWTIGLSDYVDADAAEVNVADFWPAEVDQMTYKGKLFALPYDFSNIGIYYNKDMFTAAGEAMPPATWKWDDLAALSAKFVKKDASGNFTNWGLRCTPGTGSSWACSMVGAARSFRMTCHRA